MSFDMEFSAPDVLSMCFVTEMSQTDIRRREEGHTLMEIIAALAILGILSATALPRYIDLGITSRKRILEAGVAKLNYSLHASWYKSIMEYGKGDFRYFNPTLGEDIVITNQESGKQPRDGLIYVKRGGEKYTLSWTRPNGNPGRFVLGAMVK